MIEVRSYRRVFDLERRIYSVDRLQLNPGGVPVRGVVYFLGLIAGAIVLSRLPLLGVTVSTAPWYVRDLFGPGLLASVLSVIRVDGRTFHLAAQALLHFLFQPRRLVGLARASTVGEHWLPGPITMLPDGSDGNLRRLRYRGPGTVLVLVQHRLASPGSRPRRSLLSRRSLRIVGSGDEAALESGKVVSLGPEASLSVHAGPGRGAR